MYYCLFYMMNDDNKKSRLPKTHGISRDVHTNPKEDGKEMENITNLLGTYKGTPFDPGFSNRVIHSIKFRPTKQASIYRLAPRLLLRAAAVILILVIVSLYYWSFPRSYNSPHGALSTVSFPDGSTVLLNSGSTVTYKPFWGKTERKIQLRGEGFFDIKPSSKPFIVETFNSEVEVLGTRFSVTSWPNSLMQQTYITLEEGKINVHPLGRPYQAKELEPQQSLIIFSDSSVSDIQNHSFNKTQNMLSWRSGGYAFQDMPLGAITQELQRRGNIVIVVPDELLHKPVTYIEPKALSIQQVLDDLSQGHAFSYSQTAEGFELKATAK